MRSSTGILRLSLIFCIFVVIFFPSLTPSIAFNKADFEEREVNIPSAENDKNGAVGVEDQSSIDLGSTNEELVRLTNNMGTTKQTKVELENSYNWQVADSEGVSRTLNPEDSTTYNVDTSQISSSPSQGTYTVNMIQGSFQITADRTVAFNEGDPLDSENSIITGGSLIDGDDSSEENLNLENPSALGASNDDISGDGNTDFPYVDSEGNIKIVDSEGNKQTLGENEPKASKNKTLLGVGKWNGSPQSVFFVDESRSTIYRVSPSTPKTQVAVPPNGAQAVSGVSDIDDDMDMELVFVDSSQQLRYLEKDGTIEKISDGGLGSSSGLGAGSPPDINGNGIPRVIGVDESNNIIIVGVAEPDLTIDAVNAAKSPITTTDIDRDNEPEILYIGEQNNYIKYVDNPLQGQQIETVTDDQGNPIIGDPNIGVSS